MRLPLRIAGAAVMALALVTMVSCGPTTTRDLQTSAATETMPRPSRIIVDVFALKDDKVHLDGGISAVVREVDPTEPPATEKASIEHAVARSLTAHIVRDLRYIGWTADPAQDAAPAAGDLIVSGSLLRTDEGDSTTRLLIGLGVGRTRLATDVTVEQAQPQGRVEIETFGVQAKGGYAPGLIESAPVGPLTALALEKTAVNVSASVAEDALDPEVDEDVQHTAAMIVVQLSQVFLSHDWIPDVR